MRTKIVSLVAGLIILSLLASCQTMMTEHPGTAVGTGFGAATGAILGALVGKGAGAVVLGGLLGGLAGGLIGNYAYDVPRNREQTAKEYHYQSSQGTMLRIENTSALPHVVYPGEVVNLRMTYAVLTPVSYEEISVTEIREITHNGQLVGNPEIRTDRTGGTYSTTIPINLPPDARRGEYQVRFFVESRHASDSTVVYFRVE
jgi:outer membrane lipoprotein SlyB